MKNSKIYIHKKTKQVAMAVFNDTKTNYTIDGEKWQVLNKNIFLKSWKLLQMKDLVSATEIEIRG